MNAGLRINLDPANPGQFLACCGILELAGRLWSATVTGAFRERGRVFVVDVPLSNGSNPTELLMRGVASCPVFNTMSEGESRRLDELRTKSKKELERSELLEERAELESRRREAPVVIGAPFSLTIDWHQDDRAGGSNFKTWAGQQSIIDLALGMQRLLQDVDSFGEDCLQRSTRGDALPFNFDSDLGAQGAALDVGFSFDPLPGVKVGVRPAIELCAFVGLERFRPQRQARENRYRYCAWSDPLPPSVASAVACGAVRLRNDPVFEFRLLYRTKYLKSFLPAQEV